MDGIVTESIWESLCHVFFNDTATTEIYTLSLHDALPISDDRDDIRCGRQWLALDVLPSPGADGARPVPCHRRGHPVGGPGGTDRKSTRLNSSHANISYAVFCLKKKKIKSCLSDYPSQMIY